MLATLIHHGAQIAIVYLIIQGIVGLIGLCLVGYFFYKMFNHED